MAGPTPAAAPSVRRLSSFSGRVESRDSTRHDTRFKTLFSESSAASTEGRVHQGALGGIGYAGCASTNVTCCHSRGTTAASSMLPNGSTQNIGCRVRSSEPSTTRSRSPSDSIRLMYVFVEQPRRRAGLTAMIMS
ncbi:MAG: hypothetical protein DMD57_02185 [Gemmatimonadetes bacterium]|nr:MAG: hypothetical protein DMD57_02185 [Gemmatimonadota bacterium]